MKRINHVLFKYSTPVTHPTMIFPDTCK